MLAMATRFACLSCALTVALAQTPGTETVLHNFSSYSPLGMNPMSGVSRDAAGNLYGTTNAGGANDAGTVYKVDPAGNQTVLYSFTGKADGGQPTAGVVRDADGNLYGTTPIGGIGNGVVYKLDPGGQETVLHAFTGDADGGSTNAGVILDSDGNLYGTTEQGGAGFGVVFKLDPAGQETVLHTFTGKGDGGEPAAGVIRDAAGNLYGATRYGGTARCGVVFRIDPFGHEIVLYNFQGGTDAANPEAGLIRDAQGNLYGTTQAGGAGWGTLYKVDPSRHETVLYSFTSTSPGALPDGNLARDAAGNLYGVSGYTKTLFELTAAGELSVFYSFTGAQYVNAPNPGLLRDAAGNFYGTTGSGGTGAGGTVYVVTAAGEQTVLHGFLAAGGRGYYPEAGVVRDAAGNLYGTTYSGGQANLGVVYKVDSAGQETVLHNFDGAGGANPAYSLTMDSAGNLYGTAFGGTSGPQCSTLGCGVVYKLDSAGRFSVLHTFTGQPDGGFPAGGVTLDAAGNLYGATQYGGATGWGTAFQLDAMGHETVLYNFTGENFGTRPSSGVVIDAGGSLYGTAGGAYSGPGLVYKLDSAGKQTVLHTFSGADGADPTGNLVLDGAGNLYGTTALGGSGCTYGCGVVYQLDPSGRETVLYQFTGGPDGASPTGVVRDRAGDLFGATNYTVFKLQPDAALTVLYSFTGGADGGGLLGGVILGPNGALYGTASRGGAMSGGTLFMVVP